MCCGAGGGRMWMEEEPDKRVNTRRVEQLLETNPDTVAVACPFCMTMIDDGIKAKDMEEQGPGARRDGVGGRQYALTALCTFCVFSRPKGLPLGSREGAQKAKERLLRDTHATRCCQPGPPARYRATLLCGGGCGERSPHPRCAACGRC